MAKTTTINGTQWHIISEISAPSTFRRLFEKACIYDGRYVENVYEKCSTEKRRIGDYWWDYCKEIGGDLSSYSVCSHNTFNFTLSFNSEYGIHYITHANNFLLVPADMEN